MKHKKSIPAKQTKYKGVMYRSRLEASWAVYFEEVDRLSQTVTTYSIELIVGSWRDEEIPKRYVFPYNQHQVEFEYNTQAAEVARNFRWDLYKE